MSRTATEIVPLPEREKSGRHTRKIQRHRRQRRECWTTKPTQDCSGAVRHPSQGVVFRNRVAVVNERACANVDAGG